MQRSSGAIYVELRAATETDAALRALRRARTDIFRIPHPEQRNEPFASFVSEVEPGPRGPGFSFDMTDAEAYEGILEEALERILIALTTRASRRDV